MKVQVNTFLQSSLVRATESLEQARTNHHCAVDDFNKSLEQDLAAAGLGKRAIVEHVHAAAHHGNLSSNLVLSEVVNVHTCNRGGVYLRIRLGSATRKDKLTDQYASLLVADVLRITTMSNQPFKE